MASTWWKLGFGALLIGTALSTAGLSSRPSLCFEHIGPQDKPMPEFCVAPLEGSDAVPTRRPVMAVSDDAYDEVARLVQGTAPAVPNDTVGKYQVVSNAWSVPKELGPEQMCAIADVLSADIRRRGIEDFAPVQQLRRRLCQARDPAV